MKKIFMMLSIITSLLLSEPGDQLGYYENSSFGFSLKYPSDLLTEKTYPENGDGVSVKNKSGTVMLTPSGRYAIDTESIEQGYKDTIAWKNEDKNNEITYKVQKKNWFVLSGHNDKDKTIFYDKRWFVYNRAENSNVIVGFNIEFPAKDKKKYDTLIKIVSESFKLLYGESYEENSNLDATKQDLDNGDIKDKSEMKALSFTSVSSRLSDTCDIILI